MERPNVNGPGASLPLPRRPAPRAVHKVGGDAGGRGGASTPTGRGDPLLPPAVLIPLRVCVVGDGAGELPGVEPVSDAVSGTDWQSSSSSRIAADAPDAPSAAQQPTTARSRQEVEQVCVCGCVSAWSVCGAFVLCVCVCVCVRVAGRGGRLTWPAKRWKKQQAREITKQLGVLNVRL